MRDVTVEHGVKDFSVRAILVLKAKFSSKLNYINKKNPQLNFYLAEMRPKRSMEGMHPIDQLKHFRNQFYLTDEEEEELKREKFHQHESNYGKSIGTGVIGAFAPVNFECFHKVLAEK